LFILQKLGKLRFTSLSSWVKPKRFDDDNTRYKAPHDCPLGNTNTNTNTRASNVPQKIKFFAAAYLLSGVANNSWYPKMFSGVAIFSLKGKTK
jgi:hypothetical protein